MSAPGPTRAAPAPGTAANTGPNTGANTGPNIGANTGAGATAADAARPGAGPTADPAALAALHRAAFTLPRPWSAAEFGALLASPRHLLLQDAQAPNVPAPKVLALAVLALVADEAELLTIAVAPAAQGRGLGRHLLARALAAARARGAAAMFLEVAADNAPALALYRGAGFRPVGRRSGYYRDGGRAVDAVVMRLELAPAPAG